MAISDKLKELLVERRRRRARRGLERAWSKPGSGQPAPVRLPARDLR